MKYNSKTKSIPYYYLMLILQRFITSSKILKVIASNLLVFLSKTSLLPKRLRLLSEHIKNSEIFRQSKLSWSNSGYWFLDPMPNENQLQEYYSNTYWEAFHGGKHHIMADTRALDHFSLLDNFGFDGTDKKKRILNFGSGEGGISYLFSVLGLEVVNVEPSEMIDFKWSKVNHISEAKGKFDLIYSSHSLEHVADLEETMDYFSSFLEIGGFLFIEVPNCRQSNTKNLLNGGENGEIVIPHTYYFTKDFFENLEFTKVHLSTYTHQKSRFALEANDLDGDFLRYVGKKN